MKTYIGIRLVKAEPMPAEEASKHGYKLPKLIGDGIGYGISHKNGKKRWIANEAFEKWYINDEYWEKDIRSNKFKMLNIHDYFEG